MIMTGYSSASREKMLRRAMLHFRKQLEFDGDLSSYLATYSKNGYAIDPSVYSIRLRGKHGRCGICRDTSYAFLLKTKGTRKNNADALIGFDTRYKNQAIEVKQIQGRQYRQKALKPLRWEKMLLRMATDWAGKSCFKQVRVQKAENNKWWDISKPKRNQRLKMKYDVTARRSGFYFDKDLDCYVLDL